MLGLTCAIALTHPPAARSVIDRRANKKQTLNQPQPHSSRTVSLGKSSKKTTTTKNSFSSSSSPSSTTNPMLLPPPTQTTGLFVLDMTSREYLTSHNLQPLGEVQRCDRVWNKQPTSSKGQPHLKITKEMWCECLVLFGVRRKRWQPMTSTCFKILSLLFLCLFCCCSVNCCSWREQALAIWVSVTDCGSLIQ